MSFKPVHLVHPKTGTVVTATTAVDLTNFRFDGGYIPADHARTLVKNKETAAKHPHLAEGLKKVDQIEADVAAGVKSEVPSTQAASAKK